jgi:hypothetical protein
VSAGKGHDEMMRRLRVGNIKTLLRWRWGHTLPDDDAGREDLHELLLPISLAPQADIKMPKAIEVWAPWMQSDEAQQLVDRINRTPIHQRKPTARQLGRRQHVTNEQREQLRLWTITPFDMTAEQLAEQRKAKARARMHHRRRKAGSKARRQWLAANSNSRLKPWKAEGISRAAWYRRRETGPCAELKKQRETGPCEVKLSSTANGLVSPELAPPPRKRRANGHARSKAKSPTKAEKPKRKRANTSDDVTDCEIRERTCLTVAVTPITSARRCGSKRSSRTLRR